MHNYQPYKYNGFTYKVFQDKLKSEKVRDFCTIKSEIHKDIPHSLYKYYDLNPYGIQALLCNQLFASHPYHFNDPFDCDRELIDFNNSSLDEVLSLNKAIFEPELIKKLYYSTNPDDKAELNDKLKYIAYNVLYMHFGIFSMSSNYKSMVMWSYYNSHRGFCLKMNLKLLPDNYLGPFPINYTSEFKPIDYSELRMFSFLYQSSIKAVCWEDESEWRLLFHSNRALKVPCFDNPKSRNRIFSYDSKVVEEIILGFYFFDHCEIDTKGSTKDSYFVNLKNNKKQKQEIIKYTLSRNIPISIINLKNKTTSEIEKIHIEIINISSCRYRIKYIK